LLAAVRKRETFRHRADYLLLYRRRQSLVAAIGRPNLKLENAVQELNSGEIEVISGGPQQGNIPPG